MQIINRKELKCSSFDRTENVHFTYQNHIKYLIEDAGDYHYRLIPQVTGIPVRTFMSMPYKIIDNTLIQIGEETFIIFDIDKDIIYIKGV